MNQSGKKVNDILRQILDDPAFQESAAWRRRDFYEKDVIVRAGDEGATLYYIEAGRLRVTGQVELNGDKRVQPGFLDLQSGDVFGEMCLNATHQRTATVTAIADGCVLEIDGARLNAYFDTHPLQGYRFYKKLFEILMSRMKSANSRIENLLAWGLKAHGIERHL